jgi:hypothetical protein
LGSLKIYYKKIGRIGAFPDEVFILLFEKAFVLTEVSGSGDEISFNGYSFNKVVSQEHGEVHGIGFVIK